MTNKLKQRMKKENLEKDQEMKRKINMHELVVFLSSIALAWYVVAGL